jgi:DNA-binding PadR family transcriptional regulator
MFFRHNHHPDAERFGRGPFGGFGGRHGHRHGGGFGGRESRVFDSGELKLVILAMIAEKPRHGYELMKDLGERVGGEYTPSPGVIYPTLTLLEEMGFATQTTDANNRKLYAVTPEGEKFLADNKPQADAIFARLDERTEASSPKGMGSLFRAMMNLRASVKLRVRSATPEQIQQIVDALDAAAKTIERL